MVDTKRQDREIDVRENFERPKQWAPASALPNIKQQDGWSYRWIRTSMGGQADATNVSKRMREGWEPVKLSEHPELQLYTDPTVSRFQDSVEVGGLILCKTPKEFTEQRSTHYSKQTQSQTEAIDNNFMKENDARMPLFKEKRTSTSFGNGN
tara:strand:- start:2250 stop:2705 length:456 start_codon:yes stop_codon:yes gene_type:complete